MAEELIQETDGPAGLRVIIDRELCIGAGDCVAVAQAAFGLDRQNRVILLNPVSVAERLIWRAAERCPTDAIILEDAQGTPLYP